MPNRVLFFDRLELAMAQATRQSSYLAVLVLDLDHFKSVNDTLGYHIGDDVLKGVGERISSVLRKGDTVARMGGDEFVIVLSGIEDVKCIDSLAERVRNSVSRPFDIEGHDVSITASIGIALYPGNGENAESLVRHADIAMYDAKDAGRDCFRVFGKNSKKACVV